MGNAIIVLLLTLSCCFFSISMALAFPFPKTTDGNYDAFKKIADGRVPPDLDSKATPYGIPTLCPTNCDIDFTCKGFSQWKKNDRYWCLKSTQAPNPWMSIPQLFVNSTEAEIFAKK